MFFSFYKQFWRALIALASELKQNGINQLKPKPWDVEKLSSERREKHAQPRVIIFVRLDIRPQIVKKPTNID
tara:strand:+ start:67 stop:282 length:216 start_codon:yes stop_codon:yes gene_type:complete